MIGVKINYKCFKKNYIKLNYYFFNFKLLFKIKNYDR